MSVGTMSPLWRVIAVAFLFVLGACGGGSDSDDDAIVQSTKLVSLSFDSAADSVQAYETQFIPLRATYSDGSTKSPTLEAKWTVDNAAVAAIAFSGSLTEAGVRGVAPGSTVLTVSLTEGGITRSVQRTITVLPPRVANIWGLPQQSLSMGAGETLQLGVVLSDLMGKQILGRDVTWSTSNPSVAAVSPTGVLAALTTGTAQVTANVVGDSASVAFSISVNLGPAPVASVLVTADRTALAIGETTQAYATPRDSSGAAIPGRFVTWSSSNMSVLTVSSSGVVTGTGEGTAQVIATVDGKQGAQSIVVESIGTPVGGILNVDTTWTMANSPYRLTSDVQVDFSTTLTIEPGVVVYGGGRLVVGGTLQAVGTAAEPIRLYNLTVRASGSLTAWHYINLEHVVMAGGQLYPATGNAVYGTLRLVDSRLSDMWSYIYLWYPTSSAIIERNVFLRTGGISVGFDSRTDAIDVTVRNNYFEGWTGVAIESWAAYGSATGPVVEFNTFASTDRIALSLPRGGYTNTAMTAIDNWWLTTDLTAIGLRVFDRNDDITSAAVIPIDPPLTAAHPDTPVP